MMDEFWFIVALLITAVLLGLAIFLGARAIKDQRSGKTRNVNYRAIFFVGVSLFPIGIIISIAEDNSGLLGTTALGLAYMAIGLSNRDKWKSRGN